MDNTIVKCAIHPAIGIARVGNSVDEYFFGPEFPGQVPSPPGGFKDPVGAIKRQAARFRVYGLNAAGQVVKEITAEDATITWTVHVANKKAAWYEFDTALDIPGAVPTPLRNPEYQGDARAQLVVDPGPRSVSGVNCNGESAQFDTGKFIGVQVYLGELRTDEAGRLIFLGGRGHSFSPFPFNPPSTFANNNGWCDDISDGPVFARVEMGGQVFEPYPAWVVTAPPDYAPNVTGFVTMYDVIDQTVAPLRAPSVSTVSFVRDIYPLFRRLVEMQWVNYGSFVQNGFGSPNDYLVPNYLARLADKSEANKEFRNLMFIQFRNPSYAMMEPQAIPQIYGDGMDRTPQNARQWLTVTQAQYAKLAQWAKGDFESDLDMLNLPAPASIEDAPLHEQQDLLDRAALQACLGGAFHPGCEATWPMRQLSMYFEPFRLRLRPAGEPIQYYGALLTPDVALSADGPLAASSPGDVSRWMAVPWQTDTASCRSGYDRTYDAYLPTFWPARVPNQVFTQKDYDAMMDPNKTEEERQAAFHTRKDWLRHIAVPNYQQSLQMMVENWYKLGIVVEAEGPQNDPSLPSTVYVETGDGFLPQTKIAPLTLEEGVAIEGVTVEEQEDVGAHASLWAHAL